MKFTTFLRFMTLQMNARLQPKELNIVLGGSTVLLGITAIVTMILRQRIWLYLVLTAVMFALMLLCHADLRTPVCKKSGRISAKAVR